MPMAFLTQPTSPTLYDEKPELDGSVYTYLTLNLTPKHFLSDAEFNDHKIFYYNSDDSIVSSSDENDKEEFYNNPKNLSFLGLRKVQRELERLNNVYNNSYRTIKVLETGFIKSLLTPDEFLSLYLYTTNLGYPKINSQLRFGHNNDCDYWILLINQSIDKLNTYKRFQLCQHQHQLTRHLNVSEEILQHLKECTLARKKFIDKAFLSTSFNNGGAAEFKGNISIKIEMRGALRGPCIGIRLDEISPFRSEGECLFRPGSTFDCHPINPIEYDPVSKKLQINVCAVTVSRVAKVNMLVFKFINNLKKAVEQKKIQSLPTDPEVAVELSKEIKLPIINTLPSYNIKPARIRRESVLLPTIQRLMYKPIEAKRTMSLPTNSLKRTGVWR